MNFSKWQILNITLQPRLPMMQANTSLLYSLLFGLTFLLFHSSAISADNICTFHIGGKLFSLVYLDEESGYELQVDSENSIFFNFCSDFVPAPCQQFDAIKAYSFLVKKSINSTLPKSNFSIQINKTVTNDDADIEDKDDVQQEDIQQGQLNGTQLNVTEAVLSNLLVNSDGINDDGEPAFEGQCIRYSTNSYTYYFRPEYVKADKLGTLHLNLYTKKGEEVAQNGLERHTEFIIECSDYEGLEIQKFSVSESKITVHGNSLYGCPAFSVSKIWQVFQQNQLLFGVILLVLGLYMLFYGRVAIQVTIFSGAFFISLAIVGSIFTLFVSPYSSTFVMYFSCLLLLTICTLLAYGVTRLVNASIFFVGAFLGFIIAILVNSIFCGITDIYSVWSFVIFVIFFTIPFGVLTFKYRNEIIIASSSLTGAYLVIRPISWIFGGFPNQFLLYHLVETNQLDSLPWSFFGYLILIVALALVGCMYQLLKLYRQSPQQQVQVNAVQEAIEQPIDSIKQKVDNLIQRFKPQDRDSKEYKRMKEMKETPSKPVRPKNQLHEEDLDH